MKQKVRTKNYNATIQIPYQKLARQSNTINLQNLQPQKTIRQQNYTKTIIVPHCNGCCQPNNPITLKMIEQLESSYEIDMRQKNDKIKGIQNQSIGLRLQLTENKKQIQNYKFQVNNLQKKQENYQKSIKDRDEQIGKLRKQIQLAQLEKQKILRTKITEFQNSYLQYQKSQAQKIARLQAESQRKLKQEISNLNLRFQQEKAQLKQQITQLRLSSQYQKAGFDREKQVLNEYIVGFKSKIEGFEHKLFQSQQRQRSYRDSINQKQTKIRQNENNINQLQKQISKLNQLLSQSENQIKALLSKFNLSQSSYQQLQQKYLLLDTSHKSIFTVSQQYQLKIKQTTKNIEQLLLKIQQLKKQILFKDNQLKNKDNPKVYQVKIQKVIDRKQYIQQLQRELQIQRKKNFDGIQRIKDLQRIIIAKQKQLQEKVLEIGELQLIIKNLKLYIEQKQKSFAWIVQRQITKDIQLNQKQINRTYKVYPSEPVFNSPLPYISQKIQILSQAQKSYSHNQQIKVEDGMRMGFQRYIDSTTILQQLEGSNQLGDVIFREVSNQQK